MYNNLYCVFTNRINKIYFININCGNLIHYPCKFENKCKNTNYHVFILLPAVQIEI